MSSRPPSSQDDPTPRALFWICAAAAWGLHALLAFDGASLRGGADLLPHLRLIELMGEAPALRTVYAPTYHVLGALLTPLVGLEAVPKLFAFLAAPAWMLGARFLQRAAGLPAAAAVLLVLWPYAFAFSACLPKVEALGYGLAFLGLGLLLRERRAAAALVLGATFWVHTASALFLGLSGGVLALARRDLRALVALAIGSLGAAPLTATHLAAGCTLGEALRLTGQDYLRVGQRGSLHLWPIVLLVASPPILVLAAAGARDLWRRHRALALLCAFLAFLYLNEVWLGLFGMRISLNLTRGLSVLALPVCAAAGVALTARPRALPWLVAGCALWTFGAVVWAMPRLCHVRSIQLSELENLRVDRCTFTWRFNRTEGPALRRPPRFPEAAPAPGVDR